ncbi:MAG: GGDEF domain-containing protein [Clostridia bacterium]|nr:GGDEF domain-containing protein [Clostridia bacterium]
MTEYIIHYTESNVVCIIIFGIILFYDLLNENRRERQIKYDHALIAFMVYFFTDIFWAMVIDGVITRTLITVAATSFANYISMVGITYFWLEYAKAVLHSPNRNKKVNRFASMAPFVVSTLAMVIIFFADSSVLFNEELVPTMVHKLFLIGVPCINIGVTVIYSVRKAVKEVNTIERTRYLMVGFLPVFVVVTGIIQLVLLPQTSLFCFGCAIIMVTFHIQTMQTAISVDSLTGLNNRGQLIHFTAQLAASKFDSEPVFVVMMDVNDFKAINDTFGHAEGDRALVIIAKALKATAKEKNVTMFLGRYGGDEFIMVIRSGSETELAHIIEELRDKIILECKTNETPYTISIGAGYDRLLNESDSFRKCLQRADKNLYEDKERCKEKGYTTVILKD